MWQSCLGLTNEKFTRKFAKMKKCPFAVRIEWVKTQHDVLHSKVI